MSPLHESQTKRRQISERDAASHSETQTLTEMKELYWLAMALTGDPEFATRLLSGAKCREPDIGGDGSECAD